MIQQILVSGQPRTGYALFNTIVHKLLLCSAQLAQKATQCDAQALFKQTGVDLYHGYKKALNDNGFDESQIIINGEFKTLCGGPQWFDEHGNMYVRKYIGIVGHGDILLTHKIPSVMKFYYDTIHSHDKPTNLLNTAKNTINFATIRNPLGIFNSANHSINALSSEYLQRFKPDISQTLVREEMSIYKFSDLKLCEGLIKHQKNYWDEFIDLQQQFNIIKWEDLITHPISTLTEIAAQLNIQLDPSTLSTIWHSMDHVNTMLYHQHNYRQNKGIIGDWKNNLVNEHIALFEKLGFNDILQSLGYQPLSYMNPKDYNTKQQTIAHNIAHNHTAHLVDKDFATFCFNKSNIDASAYNFYAGDWVDNTKIERATFINSALLDALVEQSNNVLNSLPTGHIKAVYENNSSFEKMQQRILNSLQNNEPIALWGLSYDFVHLVNNLQIDLNKYPNLYLYDHLEAGLILQSKHVLPSSQLHKFKGTIFAIVQHSQAIESMTKFAQAHGFIDKLITKEHLV